MEKEEILNNESGNENVGDSTDYIDAINEMKKNTVSRESYDKLKEENSKLLKSLIDGGQVDMPSQETPTDIDALRKELFNPDGELSNLEYASKALELRDAVIASGGKDPFMPNGHNYQYDEADARAADRVATVMRECIEVANGNSEVFTAELMRRTNESPRMFNKRR